MADDIVAQLKLLGQSAFSSGAKQASKDVEGIGKSAEKSQDTVKKSGKGTALGLLKAAAAAGVTYKAYQGLKSSVNTTVDLAKNTAGLARVTGLDKKQAQAWSVVAKERGIQAGQLQMGMASFGRALGALGGPTKTTDTALSKLGLSSKQLLALPMQQRMNVLSDAFSKLPNGVDKAALSQKLFGRSGRTLLPLLNSGSAGLNEQLNAASKLVPPLGAAGASALQLAAKQRQLKTASLGIQVAIGTALLPVLSSLATAFAPIIGAIGSFLGQCKPAAYAVIALGAALVGLMIVSTVAGAIDGLTTSMIAQKVAAIASAGASKALAAAQWILNAAMSANPIFLIIAALVALGVAFVVMYNKVGWFRAGVQAAMHGVVAAFNWVKNAAISVFNWIKGNWPILVGVLAGPFGVAVALIITHFDKVKGAAQSVFNTVKSIFGKIPGIIKGIFTGAVGLASDVGRGIADWLNANTPFGDKVHVGPVSFTLPALAEGGLISQGGTALVGERGPELVTLPTGAAVMPLPSVTGQAQTVNVPVYLDRRQIALATGEYYADQAARKGKKP